MIPVVSQALTAPTAIELAHHVWEITKTPTYAGPIDILRRYVTIERKSLKKESRADPRYSMGHNYLACIGYTYMDMPNLEEKHLSSPTFPILD